MRLSLVLMLKGRTTIQTVPRLKNQSIKAYGITETTQAIPVKKKTWQALTRVLRADRECDKTFSVIENRIEMWKFPPFIFIRSIIYMNCVEANELFVYSLALPLSLLPLDSIQWKIISLTSKCDIRIARITKTITGIFRWFCEKFIMHLRFELCICC